MAWTTPATAVAATALPASTWNATVRDNLKAIGDPWPNYTPSWTSTGTAPALGNGTLIGKYMQAGKTIRFVIVLTMGSTTTYGTGNYSLTLPFATVSGSSFLLFTGDARDDSLTNNYVIYGLSTSGTTGLSMRTLPTTAGNPLVTITNLVPFTWANLDTLTLHGSYESV